MATIQFDNGQKVQFNGTPTEQDIEEVAKSLGITKEKSFLRKAGDFFTSSTQKFGKTIGTAASTISPKLKKQREETIKQRGEMIDNLMEIAKNEPDKEKAKRYLETIQELAQEGDIDVFQNKEYQKTAKQILGEAGGTALEIASFGSYGKGATAGLKSFKLGKAGTPTIAKPLLKPGKSVLQGVKQGAKIGGVYGSAFGLTSAMEENKNFKEMAKSTIGGGLTGSIGGGLLGGTISGLSQGIPAILSRASRLANQGKKLLGKQAEKKLLQTSRELTKMSPTATKNEAKWQKNTPEFIANEFVIDEKTLKPKSILQLIDSDGRRIDNTEAVNALRRKYNEESRAFNSLLEDSGEYISLNKLQSRALKNVNDLKVRGDDYNQAIKQIEKEIKAYKSNYKDNGLVDGDDLLIRIDDFNKIKSGLWSKTSNFNPSQSDKLLSDVSYRMGQTAKDLVEESVEDVAVKRMNKRLGDMASAINVLQKADGKVIPGGFFGRQLTRIAGTVAGTPGGVGGSIIGNITGGALADIMMNPKVKTSIWAKLYQNLNKTKAGKSIIDEAVEILQKRGKERASRKLLEAPKYIPLGGKADTSRLLTQEEANIVLDSIKKSGLKLKTPKAKGETIKTTHLKSKPNPN